MSSYHTENHQIGP